MLPRSTLVSFLMVIVTRLFGKTKGRYTAIRDPLYRYLHRCIATSIAPRFQSREWCNKSDLFYLYCLLRRQPCALHLCLAQWFNSAHHRQERGILYGGAYITMIAHRLGYAPDLDPRCGPPIPSTPLGRTTLIGMRVTFRFQQIGLRFRDAEGAIFVPQALPEVIPDYVEIRIPEDDEDQGEIGGEGGGGAEGGSEGAGAGEGVGEGAGEGVGDQPQSPPRAPRSPPPPPPSPPQPPGAPQYPQHVYADMSPAVAAAMEEMQRRIMRHVDRQFEEQRHFIAGLFRSHVQRVGPGGRRLGGDPGQGSSGTRPSPPGGADGGDDVGLD